MQPSFPTTSGPTIFPSDSSTLKTHTISSSSLVPTFLPDNFRTNYLSIGLFDFEDSYHFVFCAGGNLPSRQLQDQLSFHRILPDSPNSASFISSPTCRLGRRLCNLLLSLRIYVVDNTLDDNISAFPMWSSSSLLPSCIRRHLYATNQLRHSA